VTTVAIPGSELREIVHAATREYLTTNEVADLCRTSPETVRYWRYRGEGPPGTKVGRKVLYRESDVRAWLATLRATQAAV
jgi:excisionase family DNA binding protein